MKPSYQANDPRGWCGDPRRGAAMGRGGIYGIPCSRLTLRRIPINAGGYDSLGTYWGLFKPLYWCADESGAVDFCLRARDRAEAKAAVLADIPTGEFYR